MALKQFQVYVSTFCLLLLMVLLGGCAFWGNSQPSGGATTQQAPLTPAQLKMGPLLHAPLQGWRHVLGNALFSAPEIAAAGASNESGLVASTARPGRVAGCAMPTISPATLSAPLFVLSDDAGRTWVTHTITGAGRTSRCAVVADTRLPDAFIVNEASNSDAGSVIPSSYITWNAGQTWSQLPKEDSNIIAMVNGVALAILSYSAPFQRHLAECTILPDATCSWQTINIHIPEIATSTTSLEAVAEDSNDPSRLFVAMSTGAFGVTVYATTDAGASWHSMLRVPTAITVLLWTANNHQVFLDVYRGQDAPYQLYYSADNAVTWNSIATHYLDGGESIYCSPSGRLVTMTVQSAAGHGTDLENFFTLDPTTGVYSLIGTYPFASGISLGVVVDEPTPTFIYGNYLRSLPPK